MTQSCFYKLCLHLYSKNSIKWGRSSGRSYKAQSLWTAQRFHSCIWFHVKANGVSAYCKAHRCFWACGWAVVSLSGAFLSFVLWDTEEHPLCVSVCLSTGGLFPGDSHEYEVFRFALAQNQDIPKLVPQVDMVDTSSSFAMTYACKFIDRWRSGVGQRVTLCWCLGYFTTFLTELFNSGINSILCTCASAVSFHGAFLLDLISFYKAVQVPCSSFRYLNWYEWMQAGGPGA